MSAPAHTAPVVAPEHDTGAPREATPARTRIRVRALLLMSLALAFYFGFIALTFYRSHR